MDELVCEWPCVSVAPLKTSVCHTEILSKFATSFAPVAVFLVVTEFEAERLVLKVICEM